MISNWTCDDMVYAINCLLCNNCVCFCNKVFRAIAGIPMVTHSAPLIADLFLYCYESQFINEKLSKHSLICLFNNEY